MDKLSVLVVEDEDMLHALLREALDEAGFAVEITFSGEQAIARLEQPDAAWGALVTDIQLTRSGATGWDVARRARELEQSLPVIYMTGDAAADWASQGVPNSILVTKPFAPAQIVTAISQLLNVGSPPAP